MNHSRIYVSMLLLVLALTFPHPPIAAATNVENRIREGIEFILGQFSNSSKIRGFLHDTTGSPGSGRIYSEDNGFVVLALASYQETHFSSEFYSNVKLAVRFLQSAQTRNGDFYEYYNIANDTWGTSGNLYYWNSFTILGPAYAAYTITNQNPEERSYWSSVIDKLRLCVEYWLPRNMRPDGSITFAFPGQTPRADVASNAAMLIALIHLALFEHLWGDAVLARRYAQWSLSIANWLFVLQETNSTSWGRGGFYTNTTSYEQSAFGNAMAMSGLNSYYKAISLLLQAFQPSLYDVRQSMIDWAEGYVEKMLDRWGGIQAGRINGMIISYPKPVVAASATLVSMVDVWIDIGAPRYWNDSLGLYSWLTGENEYATDLQSALNLNGHGGGFYAGVDEGGVIRSSDLFTTSFGLYAIIRAAFVRIPGVYPIPEFPPAFIAILALMLVVVLLRRVQRID